MPPLIGFIKKSDVLVDFLFAFTLLFLVALNGLLFDFAGYDILGSEKGICDYLKSMEFECECADFEVATGKNVSFLRVAYLSEVGKQSVAQVDKSSLLVKKSSIPSNVLWVLLTGDNGGKSSKFLISGNEQHSVHANGFLVSKETVVLRRWERSKQKFGIIKRVDKG